MADRYDNSFSRRPNAADSATGRRADPAVPAEQDPLVELARIVSGKSSFDDLVGGRPQAAPTVRQQQPPQLRPQGRDVSFDLESELLNDLQSSFDPTARPAPPRYAAPEPERAPARESFDQMRLRGGQPAAPARPQQMAPAPEDDPYAGTAYATSGYDAPRTPGARSAQPFGGGSYRAGQENAVDEPSGGYDEYYPEDDQSAGYDDDADYDDQAVYAEDEVYEQPERPSRSRKGLITAAIVLAVVLAGGLAALALKDRSSTIGGAPKVIAADQGPTKVQPAAQPSTDDGQQNKMIYDRASQDPSQEQLVLPDDGAIDQAAPSNESAASREISRIILPGAPGSATSSDVSNAMNAASAPADDATADDSDAGPRKVRTVVVKPDGTIISSEAQPKDASGATAAATAPTQLAMTPPTSDPASPVVSAPASTPAPTTAAPATTLPSDAAASTKDASQLTEPAAAPRAAAAPKPTTRPTPSDAPAQTAAAASTQDAAPASAGGGFVVQITSQRTQDQALAAYKSLQRKFPSVLGSQQPDVVRADLGAKGVFYRVRVGPMATRDQAVSFCESLRAAGGDCIVQKN
ncbi:SPOR domain-containing protein [Kaistia dalseonensis]|uniref:SPOR domain-containing protein n=1 Tax=Kaistia dalseonensis TaxID=410840 RepID=A0ABU0H275_9HYPH|nr:SPOR domain-containing protein [Kaistia dalseonensis]MCX5493592.1 SPOR domain-containing protein [Kaistia dalseonensis]MDQ0436152.1 hypothetical protein [Kaistia dalseonensis]